MNKLSPAALAVEDAIKDWMWDAPCPGFVEAIAATALRVAADQAENVCSARPSTKWGEGWLEGVNDVAAGLRRIASELEAQ